MEMSRAVPIPVIRDRLPPYWYHPAAVSPPPREEKIGETQNLQLGPRFGRKYHPAHTFVHSILEKVDLPRVPRRPEQEIWHKINVRMRWPEIIYQPPSPRIPEAVYDQFPAQRNAEMVEGITKTAITYVRNGAIDPDLRIGVKCSLGPKPPEWYTWRSSGDEHQLSRRVQESINDAFQRTGCDRRVYVSNYGEDWEGDGMSESYTDWKLIVGLH
jgi:hypothetical protein